MSKLNNVFKSFLPSSAVIANVPQDQPAAMKSFVRSSNGEVKETKSSKLAAMQEERDRLLSENATLRARSERRGNNNNGKKETGIFPSPFIGSTQIVFKTDHTSWKGVHLTEEVLRDILEHQKELLEAAAYAKLNPSKGY